MNNTEEQALLDEEEQLKEHTMIERPEIVADEHLEYLDNLRESGETNIYGAGRYLEDNFPELQGNSSFHSSPGARQVLKYWMESFTERHPS